MANLTNITSDLGCVVRTDYKEDFDPPIFNTTSSIENMHKKTPRFGHARDINLLIEGNNSQQTDYLTGLLGASVAVFGFFTLWMFCLLCLKCMGPARVGFLSAKRQLPVRPTKPACLKQRRKNKRRREKPPLQHNGLASTLSSSQEENNSPVRKVGKAVVQAPKQIMSKARETKRQLEAKMERRKQFSKIQSHGSYTEEEVQQTEEERSLSTSHSKSLDLALATEGSKSSTRMTDGGGGGATTSSVEEHSTSLMMTEQAYTLEEKQDIAQYTKDWEDYCRLYVGYNRRISRCRILVSFCCLGIVISSVLFTIMGMDGLSKSLDTFKTGLNQVDETAEKAIQLINLFEERQQAAQESTNQFVLEANDVCPEIAASFCTNVTDNSRQCDFSALPFGDALESLFLFFDGTLDLVFEELGKLEGDLLEVQDLMEKAMTYYPKHFEWAFWVAAGSTLGLGALSLCLVFGIICLECTDELPQAFKWLRSWLVVPLFILLTWLGLVFSIIFVTGSTGTADFCYDSPDTPVLNLLAQVEDEFDSVVYFFLVFYVKGCPVLETPEALEQHISILGKLIVIAIQAVSTVVAEEIESSVPSTCESKLPIFQVAAEALGNQFCVLAQTLSDVRLLFQCDNWYPIYEETVRNAICLDLTSGLSWVSYVTT